MASFTSKFNLRKPDGADTVNVTTDINDTLDKIDKLLGHKALVRRTAGNMVFTNFVGWNELASGTLDLTVKAIPGDWIEVGASGLWDAQNSDGFLDVLTIANNTFGGNSGSPLGTGHQGIMAWRGEPGRQSTIAGGTVRQCLESELSGGSMYLRLRSRVSGSVSRNIWGNADIPFSWWMINRGSNL